MRDSVFSVDGLSETQFPQLMAYERLSCLVDGLSEPQLLQGVACQRLGCLCSLTGLVFLSLPTERGIVQRLFSVTHCQVSLCSSGIREDVGLQQPVVSNSWNSLSLGPEG